MTHTVCAVSLQERFTQDMQPHYIYSPREMTRWVRGICEALRPLETCAVEGLVRIWAHEALRLFHDRFVCFHCSGDFKVPICDACHKFVVKTEPRLEILYQLFSGCNV